MDDIVGNLLLIAVLVLLNAAFAGSELAVVSLRPSQLRRMRDQGAAGRRVAELAEDPSRFLSTVQVGITLGGFLASATAAVSLAQPLESRLEFLGGAAALAAVVIVTLALTFVTLVFGELVPKRLAMQRAEAWSLRAARPLAWLERLASPAVTLLSWTTDVTVRLLGGRSNRGAPEPTEEELRDFIAHQPGVSPARRAILAGAVELEERSVRDILVPRRDIACVDAEQTVSEALATAVASGHSRMPILEDDAFQRVVHLRELVAAPDPTAPVRGAGRNALVVPETLGVLDALKRLQSTRQQLALVANEYGTIEGIVTMEDVLEEIVGEIYDEFDRDTNEADTRSVVREADGWLRLPGAFPVHDLRELEIDLPATEQTTVAGLITEQLQRIPDAGEQAQIGEWRVEIVDVEGHAVTTIRLRRRTP